MLDLVRWRKQAGQKETLALNDDVLHARAETTDYPEHARRALDLESSAGCGVYA
jgi:hypothetical protein